MVLFLFSNRTTEGNFSLHEAAQIHMSKCGLPDSCKGPQNNSCLEFLSVLGDIRYPQQVYASERKGMSVNSDMELRYERERQRERERERERELKREKERGDEEREGGGERERVRLKEIERHRRRRGGGMSERAKEVEVDNMIR